MFLTLKDNIDVLHIRLALLSIVCVSAIANQCFANTEQDLTYHGFFAQGLSQSKHNNFINDNDDISTDLTEIGLNATYQISPTLRAAGQVTYLNGGNRINEGVRIDYLLLHWAALTTYEWQVNLYLGRIKNYHWLYSSTRDVPMTRPTIILPQSVYFDGFRDTAVGGDGAALNVNYNPDMLGEFDFNISSGPSKLSRQQTQVLLGKQATGELKQTRDFQISLYWQPFSSSWRFGVVGLNAEFEYHQGESDFYVDGIVGIERLILNSIYEGERWEFSAELMQEELEFNNFYYPNFKHSAVGEGGFVQARYRVLENSWLVARYERYYADKDDKNGEKLAALSGGFVPTYHAYQHDAVIGASYDLSDNLRWQVEHHWVQGTSRVAPVVLPNRVLNNREHWTYWAVELMYWF